MISSYTNESHILDICYDYEEELKEAIIQWEYKQKLDSLEYLGFENVTEVAQGSGTDYFINRDARLFLKKNFISRESFYYNPKVQQFIIPSRFIKVKIIYQPYLLQKLADTSDDDELDRGYRRIKKEIEQYIPREEMYRLDLKPKNIGIYKNEPKIIDW